MEPVVLISAGQRNLRKTAPSDTAGWRYIPLKGLGSYSRQLPLLPHAADIDIACRVAAEKVCKLTVVATIVNREICQLAFFDRPHTVAAPQAVRRVDGRRRDGFGVGHFHLRH